VSITTERAAVDPAAAEAIVHGTHGDPFSVLGRHQVEGGWAVRAFLPNAASVTAIAEAGDQSLATLERIHPAGLWAGLLPAKLDYRLAITGPTQRRVIHDPYAFPPAVGDMDVYLFAEGRHRDLGRLLGAHVVTEAGVRGVRFVVWAPNARRVSVVGSFNNWDGRCHPMRLHIGAGLWELFIPDLGAGVLYKYELMGPDGTLLPLRADPAASAYERPPSTASVVSEERWRWSSNTPPIAQTPSDPISIYEVHAFSWLPPGETQDWSTLADRLVPYVKQLGFTHVELMPIMEHPFGGSWGYQPLGQYAPSSRLGAPGLFAEFVDRFHQEGIGVILDWVPAHFPGDAHGLARFDGTALYEHADPREGFHPDWNTYIFNLGRTEVREFLIGSALHWLENYRVDGLRVDAVASMLYRDYSRKAGEWVPNRYGGRENLEAVSFLQELSTIVRERCPRAILVAEESTAWPGVTRGADQGGLGFDYKWNMGWMHDTLHYMQELPIHRRWHHDNITFGLIYAFSEQFVLPLSHDEVVYGKGSLIGKMPGDEWQKFANLRAYLGFMWTHPGKKLLFMGGEIAQGREWNHDTGLDWHLLDYPHHAGIQRLVRALNEAYRTHGALHRRDGDGSGFRWVVIDDREQSVFAYLRMGDEADKPVLVVCNFTPVPRTGYRVGVPCAGGWNEVLNTDAAVYGGSNLGNAGRVEAREQESHGLPASIDLVLPPLAAIVLTPSA
jgi:1,4-alpha-glucan branching enzyme